MEQRWVKHYQEGVCETIDRALIENHLATLLKEAKNKTPEAIAFQCMGKDITFAELDRLSIDFANYLIGVAGLKKGDAVGLMMPNILQYPIALFACLKCGLAVVNINPLYTQRELEIILVDSGAKAIIVVENVAHQLAKVIQKTKLERVVIATVGGMFGGLKGLVVDFLLRHIKKMVPPFKITGAVCFQDTLIQGRAKPTKFASPAPDDIAFLQYTGGTTGLPKAAMLTHRSILANVEQCRAWAVPAFSVLGDKQIVGIMALPLYHVFSLVVNCFVGMRMGVKQILIPNPRDMNGFVKVLRKSRLNFMTGVTTLFDRLMDHPNFVDIDFSGLKVTLGAGMAVPAATGEKWAALTGCQLVQAYGMTEASPTVSANPLHITKFNKSVGLPLPSTEIDIRDTNANVLPPNEVGEVWVKGPQVMKGYWQQPAETERVLTADGWLKTGDLGFMDEEGYLTLVDRKKDMILVSGFNVYPAEIEGVLTSHEGIIESAVIGIEDNQSGQRPKAFVVRRNKNLTEEEVMAFCRENLTSYKMPKIIEFRDDLPKSNVGKILKKDLR